MGNQFEDGQQAYEDELLAKYATPVPGSDDAWCLARSRALSRVEALGLIRVCTGLGLEPCAVFSAPAFVALYDRLVALEQDLQHSRLKH